LANTQDKEDKGRLVKFTRSALLIEFILFVVPLLFNLFGNFPDIFSYFLAWECFIGIINLVLIITHIIEKPERFLFYIFLLFAIALGPIILLLASLKGRTC